MDGKEFWDRVDILKGNRLFTEMASKTGIKYQHIRHLRSELRYPKADEIASIADYLNSTCDFLITGKTKGSLLSIESQYVEQNPDAKLLVKAIMQNPHLLSVVSTLLRTDIDEGKDFVM